MRVMLSLEDKLSKSEKEGKKGLSKSEKNRGEKFAVYNAEWFVSEETFLGLKILGL